MNIGGKHAFPFGVVNSYMHSSSSYEVDGIVQYMGEPSGIIIQAEGKRFIMQGILLISVI